MEVHLVKVVVRQHCWAEWAECKGKHRNPGISVTTAAAFSGVGFSLAVRNNQS